MKIVHTGDWHIGKVVSEVSMLDDQIYILDNFIKLLEEEKPDVVVIAGDLYDRSVPPAKAVEVLNIYLNKIILELKIPVLAISGNHDSGERLEFGSSILKAQGFYIDGILKGKIEPIVIKECDFNGEVDFYLIPYADPAVVRYIYEDDTIRSHEDAMKRILMDINKNRDKKRRAVVVTHGYVSSMGENNIQETPREEIIKKSCMEISESERPLSIGGTDIISGSLFNDFNYVALGHLHGAQKVGSDKIRYAGSLLKYSFSEEKQKKSITIVNIDKHGEVSVELKQLKCKRNMRTIRGKLKELTDKNYYSKSNTDDYVFALLTDDGEVYEPISKLRGVYPNIMGVRKDIRTTLEERKIDITRDHINKSKLELFKDFYETVSQREFKDDRKKTMEKIIKHSEKEGA